MLLSVISPREFHPAFIRKQRGVGVAISFVSQSVIEAKNITVPAMTRLQLWHCCVPLANEEYPATQVAMPTDQCHTRRSSPW